MNNDQTPIFSLLWLLLRAIDLMLEDILFHSSRLLSHLLRYPLPPGIILNPHIMNDLRISQEYSCVFNFL